MDVKKLFVILIIVIGFTNLGAQVVINEISNKNFSQILDEDGETEDWIELFNASNSTINLEGWTLTDNLKKNDKWLIPSLELKAGAFHLIYASGKDRRTYDLGLIGKAPYCLLTNSNILFQPRQFLQIGKRLVSTHNYGIQEKPDLVTVMMMTKRLSQMEQE